MAAAHRNLVQLSQHAATIRDGDLLLFRGRGLVSWLIGIAGRSQYTHAARAIWWGDLLFCCEVRELKGGRAVTLESQVRKYPKLIDVFETNPSRRWREYDRRGAVRYMRRLAGCDYGYFGVFKAALLHLPLWRFLVRPDMNDQQITSQPPFCSEACARADRIGGRVDPVPHLSDRLTEPADLARSPFYRYRFTLAGV
ncbi:MAG: hypothetical protein MI725_12115 [Pirellulales bacterium]|nr:hypothetical protein [Pirellulales bacterium]